MWRYQYDFGDGWEHDIRVGQRLAAVGLRAPHCVDGARACPPEDCGGAPGYEHLLAVLADPADPEHAEQLERVGGEFDPEALMWPRRTRSSSSTTGTLGSARRTDRCRR
jgi:hypothetical protein